jgi:hypothetical protein
MVSRNHGANLESLENIARFMKARPGSRYIMDIRMEREEPSHDTFVIHPAGGSGVAELKKRLAQLGSAEIMDASDAGVLLRWQQPKEEPRYAWQAIRDAVGENVGVHPVLLDSGGDPHYPTGRINVRFSRAPDEAEIVDFARAHNLQTRSKNKYIPSQFVFEPYESSKRYLPDVLKQIRSEASVTDAWADTLSQYKRV